MPRQRRIQSSTDLYHVMIRGINKEFIFKTNDQKEKILELINELVQNDLIEVGAWCIMDNHVHLLLKAKLDEMSKAIKIINLKYAAYYNKIKQRIGPVFGDRYKSENISDERYLLAVIRYIHTNPLKAKIIEKIEDYKWSSYKSFLTDDMKIISNELRSLILELFGKSYDYFIDFHKQADKSIFLDTKEDMEKLKLEIGQEIISDFFKKIGIVESKDLKLRPDLIEELIKDLTENTKLTLRQISGLTGLSVNYIFSIKAE